LVPNLCSDRCCLCLPQLLLPASLISPIRYIPEVLRGRRPRSEALQSGTRPSPPLTHAPAPAPEPARVFFASWPQPSLLLTRRFSRRFSLQSASFF
jgi:hypothetical protein